jgi:hypothetical protein
VALDSALQTALVPFGTMRQRQSEMLCSCKQLPKFPNQMIVSWYEVRRSAYWQADHVSIFLMNRDPEVADHDLILVTHQKQFETVGESDMG